MRTQRDSPVCVLALGLLLWSGLGGKAAAQSTKGEPPTAAAAAQSMGTAVKPGGVDSEPTEVEARSEKDGQQVTEDEQVTEDAAAQARAKGIRDRSLGAIVQPPGADLKLVADEEGGKAVARITWASLTGADSFFLEGSATQQKGAQEVDLLNLDGVAPGDTSAKLGWTHAGRWLRRVRSGSSLSERLWSVCQDVNKALESQLAKERCPRCDEVPLNFDPIPPQHCTAGMLDDIGGQWATAGRKASAEILQAGCDELTKLDPKRVFQPVGAPPDKGGSPLCDYDALEAAASEVRGARKGALKEQIRKLKTEKDRLIEELVRREAAFAREGISEAERIRIAGERLDFVERLARKRAELARKEGELKEVLSGFLAVPDDAPWLENSWWKKVLAEKFGAVCKSYNRPDRANQLELTGFAQECTATRIKEALEAITDAGVRDWLYEEYVATRPVGAWFVTLSAGASNSDFKWVEIDNVGDAGTFKEIEDQLKSGSRTNTSLGLSFSAQAGRDFFSIGYERRNKYSGGKATEVCAPIEASGIATRCMETTAGAPKKVDQNIGAVEWRRLLTPQVGLRLRALYVDKDFRKGVVLDNEWEFHAITYFLRNPKKGLTGGVDVVWDTAFRDISARVFIGQAFEIFD